MSNIPTPSTPTVAQAFAILERIARDSPANRPDIDGVQNLIAALSALASQVMDAATAAGRAVRDHPDAAQYEHNLRAFAHRLATLAPTRRISHGDDI